MDRKGERDAEGATRSAGGPGHYRGLDQVNSPPSNARAPPFDRVGGERERPAHHASNERVPGWVQFGYQHRDAGPMDWRPAAAAQLHCGSVRNRWACS